MFVYTIYYIYVCVYTIYMCMLYIYIYIYTHVYGGLPGGSVVKNPPAKQETQILIPASGRCPAEVNGNPLQYSCLENLMEEVTHCKRPGYWERLKAKGEGGS